MDTLTGEPMKIIETFLDLLFKKRKARLVKVPVATAIPVQVLALPAPAIQLIDIQEIDVQEPALESVVIEEIKEEAKEEVHVEAEIITDVEVIEVQEEIPEQKSDSLSLSVKTSVAKKSLRKQERKIKELYTFFLSRSIEEDDEVIFIKDIFEEKEKEAYRLQSCYITQHFCISDFLLPFVLFVSVIFCYTQKITQTSKLGVLAEASRQFRPHRCFKFRRI